MTTVRIGDAAQALVDETKVYMYRGVPWVPHYTQQGTFVAPGGIEKKEVELLMAKASVSKMYLWPRQWNLLKKSL